MTPAACLPRFALLAIACLSLAACARSPVAEATPPTPSESMCRAQGGTIRPVCRRQIPTCVVRFADAGKACTDSDQCAGKCLTNGDPAPSQGPMTGACEADSDPCGCKTEIIAGAPVAGICVD